MSIQYFKKERGGVNPVGREEHLILKDPPKSIFTRKKERVNIADVMYMVQTDNERGDPTRINESIQYYQRGVNPMVAIDYMGNGGGSKNTAIHQNQAGSTNKIEVVRPPMYSAQDLVALSRPRIHQNKAVATNKSIASNINSENFIDKNTVKYMTRPDTISGQVKSTPTVSQLLSFGPIVDQNQVNSNINNDKTTRELFSALNNYEYLNKNTVDNNSVNSSIANKISTSGYSILATDQLSFGPIFDNSTLKNTVIADKESGVLYSTPTLQFIGTAEEALRPQNVDQTKIKDTLLKELNTNFSTITLYDPKTNTSIDVAANIKDKNNIAIEAAKGNPIVVNTNDGKHIKLKDYVYSIVKSNLGNTQLVIQVKQPDIILDRNTPLYAATTNNNNPIGYNENLSRSGSDSQSFKEKYDHKLTNFGSYLDRHTRVMNGTGQHIDTPVNYNIKKKITLRH
jgi:hypothetical protein